MDARRKGKMFVGPCPVHGGAGPDAFNVYPDGYSIRGNWKCRSRNCHQEFKETLVGLVWGVLSHQRLNWQGPGDKRVPFADVVAFLCDFVGQKLHDIRVDAVEAEKARFVSQMETAGRLPQVALKGWRRDEVRARMELPSAYYLGRGYSAEVLDRYDVGLWRPPSAKKSPMAGRVAVPVYDEDYRRVIGVTGRSVHGRCPKCQLHHDPSLACPRDKRAEHAKWYNNSGFLKENFLYNFWFAAEHIRATGVAVLVEGPGDVWRLEEAGVRNAVAMFGCELNDPQQVVLERSGALTVVCFPHKDEAGERSRRQIERELGRSFRLHFYDLPNKDLGEMDAQHVRRDVVPFLDGVCGKGAS